MEELTLEHVVPYLPYELKTKGRTSVYPDPIITGVTTSNRLVYWNYHGATGAWKLQDIKPILHPMSDLTDKAALHYGYLNLSDLINDIKTGLVAHWIMKDLASQLYDFNNLIGKGLAVDLNEEG